MKKIIFALALAAFVSCAGEKGGNQTTQPTPKPEEGQKSEVANVYTTTKDMQQLFKASEAKLIDRTETLSTITLDPSTRYQEMDGFGAAMTWATCYNLLKMSAEDRSKLLNELFNKETGLGISLVRVSVGASDFNTQEYTWCDEEGLENFKMDYRDAQTVIPVLKEMYKINPDVRIIASPWSTPKWMKMGVDGKGKKDSWTSGRLDPKYYQAYADYFVKWIQEMESNGFDIFALTPQNEPLNHGNSMSTYMPWQDERDFIRCALGQSLENAGLDTRILVFDHNYNYDNVADQKSYPNRIYEDAEASKYVAGSAWHDYGGSVNELDNVVAKNPEKDIYFTESSIGEWNYSWEGCLLNHYKNIFIETMKRGCKGITLWNMVLDDQKGPYSPQAGSCKTCYGAVEVDSRSYKVKTRRTHYYQIAHASKVVKQGAVRIANSGYTRAGLDVLTFLNPDGSYAALILNNHAQSLNLTLNAEKHSVPVSIPGFSLVSVIWQD